MEFRIPRRTWFVCAVVAAGVGAGATSAGAYVTDQQARDAVAETVAWYRGEQAADGSVGFFGGDWSMIALANAGVNAADLGVSATGPSLQDYFFDSWTTFPLRDSATAVERGLLTGRGGGIQGARLNSANNLVADFATYFDGSQVGSPAQVNDDIFALLAIEREGAIGKIAPALVQELRSKQEGGGWNYTGDGAPDVDVTASGIAALCAAGVPATDPAVVSGLEYLESKQDAATGGFASDFFGVNSNTTAWAVDALRDCGLDPQGERWTSSAGKTALDYFLAVQKDDGSFRWQPSEVESDPDNLYATQDAVTALVGEGFGTDPAPRAQSADPVFRPAPTVADGVRVPMTLVIDHGAAVDGAERACRVDAAVGASVDQVLGIAASGQTEPGYCATNLERDRGEVTSVNNVDAVPGTRWEVSVDGGPAAPALTDTVGLGSVVALNLAGRPTSGPEQPRQPLPPVEVEPSKPRPTAKVTIATERTLRLHRGRVGIAVRCPRGLGAVGCRGELRISYKLGNRSRLAGRRSFYLESGERRIVRVQVGRRLRDLVGQRRAGIPVRVAALVRDNETLAVHRTRVTVRLRR